MSAPKPPRVSCLARPSRGRLSSTRFRLGLALAWGLVFAASAQAAEPTGPVEPAKQAAAAPPAKDRPAKEVGKDGGERSVDFVGVLRELRSALHEVSTGRSEAQKKGDKLREICLYERQRQIAQALESAEAARVGWEAANQTGDAGRSRSEGERGQRAVELGRSLRGAAATCGGAEPAAAKPTTVTVSGPGPLDDPQPGPSESAKPNTLRLELPSRPNPASAFRPAR